MTEKIEQAKNRFLGRYKTQKNEIERAISNSIKAALQRNQIYHDKTLANKIKKAVKRPWEDYLQNMSQSIKGIKSESEYVKKISDLKGKLKESFESQGIPSDLIKICHAQKSISVFLKYLWCMGEGEPFQCPVDAKILRIVGWTGKNWTTIDDIEDHQKMIDHIRAFAKNKNPDLSIAEWELLEFL